MKARYLTFLGLFSLALTALTSCSDAIFATLETATKTATNTLSLTLNIYDIAVPSAGIYSVAAGGVFNGILVGSYPGTVGWTPTINDNTRPNNPPGTACNALTQFPPGTGPVYGGFVTSTGSASFWKSDLNYSFGTGHGTQLTTAVPGEQVTLLRSAGPVLTPNLYMGGATPTSTGFQYELDYSNNGAQWFQTNLTGLSYPITGVGFDGANYWAASSPYGLYSTSIHSPAILYTSVDGINFSPSSTNPVPSGDQINGLYSDSSNGRTFLVTRLNGIYWYSVLTGWNNISPDRQGGTTVSYLCIAGPVGSDGYLPNDIYLVGSDGYGYYTLSTGNNSLSRYGDSTIILYTSSVSRIAWDSGTSNVLMGTNANGLWRGTFDNTGALASGQSWVHE